jgi:type IV pilus assembly protein PilA
MSINRKHSAGFSLIELMMAIAILTLLMMVGSQLSRAWTDRAHVNSTVFSLKNAVSQAKIAALRNTNNYPVHHPSTSVCWDEAAASIHVIRADVGSTNGCDPSSSFNTVLYQFKTAKDIGIKQQSTLFTCLTFNAAGFLVTTPGSVCSTIQDLSFKVEKNNEEASFKIM